MIEIFGYDGEGFRVLMNYEGWKIGFLRFSERFSQLTELEMHEKTDEAFVLLEGEAQLITEVEKCRMEKNKVYNIPKGVWHHILVSRDAAVLVIENSDTSKENSKRKPYVG